MKPLCFDLFAGLGGWTTGALLAGYEVVGFDIERHSTEAEEFVQPDGDGWKTVSTKPEYYPAQLVLQDVLTIHGSQFKDAALLVASPPCQRYSWLSMPWSRSKDPENSKAAKALRREWELNGPDNRLFDACFRIQYEASEAAGRYIPMVVENVRGAQEWVGVRRVGIKRWLSLSRRERIELGRSSARYGSFHLYGDIGMIGKRIIVNRIQFGQDTLLNPNRGGVKLGGLSWSDYGKPGYKPFGFNVENEKAIKNNGGSWFAIANNTDSGHSKNPVTTRGNSNGGKTSWFERDDSGLNRRDQYAREIANGIKVPGEMRDEKYRFTQPRLKDSRILMGTKIGGDWFRDPDCHSAHGSRSSARKIASAEVAKIPPALAYYIAKSFMPTP